MGQENSHSELSAAPAQWSVRTAVVIVFGSVTVHKEPSDSVKLGALQVVCAKTPTPSQKNSARCDHNMRVLPHRTLLTRKVMTEGRRRDVSVFFKTVCARRGSGRGTGYCMLVAHSAFVEIDEGADTYTRRNCLFSLFLFLNSPRATARGESTERGCGGRVCKVHCRTISTRVQATTTVVCWQRKRNRRWRWRTIFFCAVNYCTRSGTRVQ